MLYHLIYISNSVEPFGEDDFIKLLMQSRSSNSLNEITGLLLYNKGTFIQYIEGAKTQIHRLFEKIKADTRHYNVEVLTEGEIAQRNFKNWTMEYQIFPAGELEQMLGCCPIAKSAGVDKRVMQLVKLISSNMPT
jgi:hypothetical protein